MRIVLIIALFPYLVSRRMPTDVTRHIHIPSEVEELYISELIEQRIRKTLSLPSYRPPNRKTTRASILSLDKIINAFEGSRHETHTWDNLFRYCDAKTTRILESWSLFPINELPEEILENIFFHTIYGSDAEGIEDPRTSYREIVRSRITLGSVCRHWRSLVINTPEIWSKVLVSSPQPHRYLQLCAKRAKAHPLAIFLDYRKHNWNKSESDFLLGREKMKELMTLITRNMNQIRELLIYVDTWEEMCSVLEVLKHSPPPRMLRRIELYRSGKPYVVFTSPSFLRAISSSFPLFRGTYIPSLTRVLFCGVNINYSSSNLRGLRSISLLNMAVEHMPSLEEFLSILRESPLLEELYLDGACARAPEPSQTHQQPLVVLNHLSELMITNLIPQYARFLLSLFSAPRLKRLSLENLITQDFSSVIDSLTGKFPEVTVLGINGLQIGRNLRNPDLRYKDIFISWLRTLSKVRYLRVSNVPDLFFEAFLLDRSGRINSHNISETPVCPKLEALEVLSRSVDKMIVCDFLARRSSIGFPIKDLFLPGEDVADNKAIRPETFVPAGLVRRLLHVGSGVSPHRRKSYMSD